MPNHKQWGFSGLVDNRRMCMPAGVNQRLGQGYQTTYIDFPPPPCKTLDDMTPEEIAELEQKYNAPVIKRGWIDRN